CSPAWAEVPPADPTRGATEPLKYEAPAGRGRGFARGRADGSQQVVERSCAGGLAEPRQAEQILDRRQQRVVVRGTARRVRRQLGRGDDRRDVVAPAAIALVPGDEQHAAVLPAGRGEDAGHEAAQEVVGLARAAIVAVV